MANKSEKQGYGLAIIIIVIGFVYFLFSNILNFPLILSYSPSQYISNILNLHSDYYCKSNKTFKIFDNVLDISDTKNAKKIGKLVPGSKFKFKGYQEKKAVTWVAIKIFNKNELIRGYILIPKKINISTFWTSLPVGGKDEVSNSYFSIIPSSTIENFKRGQKRKVENILKANFPIKFAKGEMSVQKISESDDYKIINEFSTTNIAYYIPKENYPKVNDIIEAYIGSNFETNYLQLSKTYNPQKDGVHKKDLLFSVIDKWYFKIAFPFIILILFKSIFKIRKKCPNCRSKKFEVQRKKIIDETYKHPKANGEKDLRYKDNPLLQRISITYKCGKCAHVWSEEIIEESNKNKGESRVIIYENKTKNTSNATKINTDSATQINKIAATKMNRKPTTDVKQKLIKLKNLHDRGKIDREEYAAIRLKLLETI